MMAAMDMHSPDFHRTFTAWKQFVATGKVDTSIVSPEIWESWQRCRQNGLDPYAARKPIRLSPREINQQQDEYSVLLDGSEPFIQLLKAAVQGSGFITTLSNRDGYVLGVWGDQEILSMAQDNNYLPGCRRTEDEVGTNAIGLALFLRKPVQVTGPEHYNINHHLWTCSSAPICLPNKELLGAITLSGKSSGAHKHTLGMVISAAEGIENKIREQQLSRERDNLNSYLDSILDSISEGIIAVDTQGRVIRTNRVAQMMLGLSHIPVIGKPLDRVIKIDPKISRRILKDGNLSDREVAIEVSGRPFFFLCSTAPIRHRGEFLGRILILTEKQRVYRLMHKLAGNSARFTFSDIKGHNPELRRQIRLAQVASKTDSRLLITGASGTGKELFAQAIHNQSPRKNGPFVAVSCAAVPRELIEAELFGYQEGAFTGAKRGGRIGKFELGDQGTLFLDEIGLIPLDMQAKLLRVLQANEITRLGDTEPRRIDVRVIAATNQDLFTMVQNREFREDLYYRLNVVEIAVPSLRERLDDMEELIDHIMEKQAIRLGRQRCWVSEETRRIFRSYHWPGNIRELENCIERALLLSEGPLIEPRHLPERIVSGQSKLQVDGEILSIDGLTKKLIQTTLEKNRGNISRSAKELKISRSTLYRKLQGEELIRAK